VTTTELLLDLPGSDGHGDHLRYHVRLATSQADVVAAQRLRHLVFAIEGGAATPGPDGLDAEDFDDRCDHLIVWHQDRSGAAQAVATFRLLPPHSNDATPRGSGLDAHRDFGLMPLEGLLDATVEVGRICVHPDHRGGAVVSLLWNAAARYLHLTGYRYLLGCGSLALSDGGRSAAAFWDFALTGYLAPAQRRCRPREPIAIGSLQRAEPLAVPPLLKGCLRLGAQICGPPGRSEMFGTADFLLLLDSRGLDRRYRRHYLGPDC